MDAKGQKLIDLQRENDTLRAALDYNENLERKYVEIRTKLRDRDWALKMISRGVAWLGFWLGFWYWASTVPSWAA